MLLEVKNLFAGYGRTQIIYDISINVELKEIVALIGHNGAGKSTTLKAIFGILKPSKGKILYMGKDVSNQSPAANIKEGIRFIPQDRYIFDKLSVMDNLEVSTFTIEDKSELEMRYDTVYNLFPILKERLQQRAGTLSGGERRMLSLGSVLLAQPRLLILDEPSLGLSPIMVQNLMNTIGNLSEKLEMSILLVEQNVKQAFELSNRVYVMKTGQIILEEKGEKLLARGEWWDLF